MSMVTLGDRNALLAFNATQPTNKNIYLDFTFLDNKARKNIQHTTYLVTIVSENKRVFTARAHSHDGHILMELVPSAIEPYHINANFDSLSASYMANYGGPIKVISNIFTPGHYKYLWK